MSDNAIACLYKGEYSTQRMEMLTSSVICFFLGAARRTAGGMVGIGELPQSNFLGHTTEMDVDE